MEAGPSGGGAEGGGSSQAPKETDLLCAKLAFDVEVGALADAMGRHAVSEQADPELVRATRFLHRHATRCVGANIELFRALCRTELHKVELVHRKMPAGSFERTLAARLLFHIAHFSRQLHHHDVRSAVSRAELDGPEDPSRPDTPDGEVEAAGARRRSSSSSGSGSDTSLDAEASKNARRAAARRFSLLRVLHSGLKDLWRSNSGGKKRRTASLPGTEAPGSPPRAAAVDAQSPKVPRASLDGKQSSSLRLDNGLQQLSDYELIKMVKRGGYGSVYLGRHQRSGEYVALKFLRKRQVVRKNLLGRVLAERDVLAKGMSSPHITSLIGSFFTVHNVCLVMEYMPGGDLYSLLVNVGRLDEPDVRTYAAEVVVALGWLHDHCVVHRDLKPDNLLVASNGHLKLADFGLSLVGLAEDAASLDGCQGTPNYLAPEALMGTAHGMDSDWWSFGIVVYELLMGAPPFQGPTPDVIFHNILNAPIVWPEVPTDSSQELCNVLQRLLVSVPEERLGHLGAADVRAHSFFAGVDWGAVERGESTAVFVPELESMEDTSYFRSRPEFAGEGSGPSGEGQSPNATNTVPRNRLKPSGPSQVSLAESEPDCGLTDSRGSKGWELDPREALFNSRSSNMSLPAFSAPNLDDSIWDTDRSNESA